MEKQQLSVNFITMSILAFQKAARSEFWKEREIQYVINQVITLGSTKPIEDVCAPNPFKKEDGDEN